MRKIFVIYLIFCVSCSNEARFSDVGFNSEFDIVSIEDIEYYKSFNVDSIYSNMIYVVPETNDFNRIGSYDKVIIEDSLIYVMDNKFTHSILCFDFSGKTVFKLSGLGSGPSEYREIRDFVVDVKNHTLEILDFGGRRIKKYHFKTGEYLGEIRFPSINISYEAIEKVDDYYIINHGANCEYIGKCGDLSIVDSSFNRLHTYLPVDKYLDETNYKGSSHFFKNMDILYFKQVYNDTIYQIDTKTGFPEYKYFIDFGPLKMPSATRFSSQIADLGELSIKAIEEKFTWGIHSFFQAGSHLFFYYEGRALTNVVYNLESRSGYRFDIPKTTKGNLFLTGRVIGAYKDYFVSFQDAENISKYARGFFGKDSVVLRNEYPEMFELMKNVEPGDNGILTFFKIGSI